MVTDGDCGGGNRGKKGKRGRERNRGREKDLGEVKREKRVPINGLEESDGGIQDFWTFNTFH